MFYYISFRNIFNEKNASPMGIDLIMTAHLSSHLYQWVMLHPIYPLSHDYGLKPTSGFEPITQQPLLSTAALEPVAIWFALMEREPMPVKDRKSHINWTSRIVPHCLGIN